MSWAQWFKRVRKRLQVGAGKMMSFQTRRGRHSSTAVVLHWGHRDPGTSADPTRLGGEGAPRTMGEARRATKHPIHTGQPCLQPKATWLPSAEAGHLCPTCSHSEGEGQTSLSTSPKHGDSLPQHEPGRQHGCGLGHRISSVRTLLSPQCSLRPSPQCMYTSPSLLAPHKSCELGGVK